LAHLLLLGIIYVSFISLGLPDGVMGVAWPAVRVDMGQPLAAVGGFTLVGTVCAAVSSYFAGAIVKRVGATLGPLIRNGHRAVGGQHFGDRPWHAACTSWGVGCGVFWRDHRGAVCRGTGCQLAGQPQTGATGHCCGGPGAALFAAHGWVGDASLAGLVLMGLGCAPIFPSLMHETARRFPDDIARTVISRQMIFAYIGIAVIPAAFGLLATWAGLGVIMPVVVALLLAMLVVTTWLDRLT
jgi:hypothetical protein